MRQVTHALLTRPPLSHKIFISEENQIECFVRLACVKHAASVHPEPGSNSHVKKFSCPVINWLNQTCIWFTVLRLFLYIETFVCCDSQHPEIHWIFQGYFTVQLSMFFVPFQTTACLLYLIKSVLSRTFFIFLKVFFNRFCPICSLSQTRQLWYLIMFVIVCQQLFSFYLENIERRRRDLNPRAGQPDLYP